MSRVRLFTIVGISITVAYISAIVVWSALNPLAMAELQPNTFGDFLAGIFGPLAFAWLVLGYFQQGEELRQNTRALEMQAEELRRSVEHQSEMVEVARQQLAAEISKIKAEQERIREGAKPRFFFEPTGISSSGASAVLSFNIVNVGNIAAGARILLPPNVGVMSPPTVAKWERGFSQRVEWRADEEVFKGSSFEILISYVDASGVEGTDSFIAHRSASGGIHDWRISANNGS